MIGVTNSLYQVETPTKSIVFIGSFAMCVARKRQLVSETDDGDEKFTIKPRVFNSGSITLPNFSASVKKPSEIIRVRLPVKTSDILSKTYNQFPEHSNLTKHNTIAINPIKLRVSKYIAKLKKKT